LHLIVLKDDAHRVFALTVNVSRLFHDNEILVVDGSGGTKDGFNLFFRHSLGHFIDIRFGNALAAT
jgi:hypothetical protein